MQRTNTPRPGSQKTRTQNTIIGYIADALRCLVPYSKLIILYVGTKKTNAKIPKKKKKRNIL